MTHQHIALLLDDARLTLDELAVSCTVSRQWIVEHVQAGALLDEPDPDPGRWTFTGSDLLRARRLSILERSFDANADWKEGDMLPRYVLGKAEGSAADNKASGIWKDSMWTRGAGTSIESR